MAADPLRDDSTANIQRKKIGPRETRPRTNDWYKNTTILLHAKNNEKCQPHLKAQLYFFSQVQKSPGSTEIYPRRIASKVLPGDPVPGTLTGTIKKPGNFRAVNG